jgi:Pyruvate/2-oxoacid:ferredoxin oxidoreductase gamma subunit
VAVERGEGVEREILVTGIGGQGVQLAANVLAHAALAEGRDVQLFGSYGGMMRGGNTDAELVVADEPIESPPTVSSAWAVLAMHPDYAVPVLARLRPGGLVLRDPLLWDDEGDVKERADVEVVDVPAADIAADAGNVMAASMVMLGALCTVTEVVALDSLRTGVRACVPSYRRQHLELNDRALEAGAAVAAARPSCVAWPVVSPSGSHRP